MMIRPSTALRNEYNDIARTCKETGQPVFITRNGEGDLVVQSMAAYEAREAALLLREKLLEAEEQLANGAKPIPVQDAMKEWRALSDELNAR